MTNCNKLKEAFLLADKITFADEPKDSGWIMSKSFSKKAGILMKNRTKPIFGYIDSIGKRAAVIIAAAVISVCALMSVKAIREPVVGFIVSLFENFTFVEIKNKTDVRPPEKLNVLYVPAHIPAGYELVSVEKNKTMTRAEYRYENKEGGMMIYLQQTQLYASVFGTYDHPTQKVDIDGYEGYFFKANGYYTLYWLNNEYYFCVILEEEAGVDELLLTARSLVGREE